MPTAPLEYRRTFDPPTVPEPRPADRIASGADRRDGAVYVYSDEIILAVNVALATRRPLLLRGPSGSGKSSLARCVARALHRKYYEEVVTSRMQARDLLWTFDTLRRLNDAHAQSGLAPAAEYIRPGVLWWAFEPATARWRGAIAAERSASSEPSNGDCLVHPLRDPGIYPLEEAATTPLQNSVVLIDEIDKADPDVPNNLLVPLGSWEFEVHEAGAELRKVCVPQGFEPPLVFITTNDERELPNAFLRRCIILALSAPDTNRLVQIATAQLGPDLHGIYQAVAEQLTAGNPEAAPGIPRPSTAEYLDALRCCLHLNVTPDGNSAAWEAVRRVAVYKDRGGSAL